MSHMDQNIINTALLFQIQSFLILLIFYYGIYQRRNRSRHVRFMATGIVWDLLLILQIELTRGAVAKAAQVVKNPWLLNFHVTIAVLTVLFYFVLIGTGRKLLRGQNQVRPWHRKIGFATIALRTLTFITSFFVVN